MPQDKPSPEKKKRVLGYGKLPQGYDLAFRWGLTLAISVLMGFFIGRWADIKLGTTPLFLLIGIFWGIGGSFYSLFLQIKKMQKDEESESEQP